jgi:hypothetical protein
MKNETRITDYASFLKAKEALKEEVHFHKLAMSMNLKEGVKTTILLKFISLTVNRLYKSEFVKKISNLFYIKTLSKNFLKSWLKDFILTKKITLPSFLKFS